MIELLHGDCLELMKIIPDKSIDMILCDLPYGTTACKWDVIIPFEPLWKEYKRIIKDRGCIALFGSEPFSSYLRMSNIKDYKYDWIWNKTFGMGQNAKFRPILCHENIIIFNSMFYYPIFEKKIHKRPFPKTYKTDLMDLSKCNRDIEHHYSDNKYPITVINLSSRIAECNPLNRVHPTQKPVALLEYLIKTYTLENETVLDNTMGSGSTGVACVNTNRNFIGIEKDDKYFGIAKNRIEQARQDAEQKMF